LQLPASNSLRGRAAIVGVGETQYYKWGKSPHPEFKLALSAVLSACADAGIDPRRVDGFSSYSDDRNTAVRLAAALDLPELRSSTMVWGGGGGGGSGAILNAAMAVATGVAECVVVLRGLAQGQFGRFGSGYAGTSVSGEAAFTNPYGLMSAAQMFAMKYQRWMHDHGGVGMEAQKAVSMAAYHHAQTNPRAVMRGRELTSEGYDDAR
jgi:acetyl-CoA acetyltransferase